MAHMNLRLDDALADAITDAAKEQGISRSEYVRRALRKAANTAADLPPSLPQGKEKSVRVQVWFAPHAYETIRAAATEKWIRPADYIRAVSYRAAKDEKGRPRAPLEVS